MSFENFTSRLQPVAQNALKFCKSRYGKGGLQIAQEIHPSISWRPSFFLRPSTSLIVSVEVSDTLFPSILKIAAVDILQFDHPISILVACPLDVFLADTKQDGIKNLREHGFGLVTVDTAGAVFLQHSCVPIGQHISDKDLVVALTELAPSLKVKFRSAHETYITNEGQGLQAAGQIVEALVTAIAKGAVKENLLASGGVGKATAELIDDLYALREFKDHRAALGGARDFAKEYRNVSSHPSKTAKQAIAKIRKCRIGFGTAIRVANNLRLVLDRKGYASKIHTT